MKDKTSRRLESIKAAHESQKPISSRVEDYLEVISESSQTKLYEKAKFQKIGFY